MNEVQTQFEQDNKNCVKLSFYTNADTGFKFIRMILKTELNCVWIVGQSWSTRREFTLHETLPSGDVACVMKHAKTYPVALDLTGFPDDVYYLPNASAREKFMKFMGFSPERMAQVDADLTLYNLTYAELWRVIENSAMPPQDTKGHILCILMGR